MKTIVIWILLSIISTVAWIVGTMSGIAIFPSELMTSASEEGASLLSLFMVSGLNSGVIVLYLRKTNITGWRLMVTLFVIHYTLLYFMSQIESLWFNDSLNMELNTIYSLMVGGLVSSLLLSLLAVWISRFIREKPTREMSRPDLNLNLLLRVTLLSVFAWPIVYFLAGYYIAWQFEAVRIFYSGTADMVSFQEIMKLNFAEGLVAFQVLRGFLWVGLGFLILSTLRGTLFHKALILGLLLSVLSASQLLLSNPVMPDGVRIGHLYEVSISNFIWGIIIAYGLLLNTSHLNLKSSTIVKEPSV